MLANSYSRGAVEKEWNWKIKMNCRRAKSVAMRRYEGCRLDAKEREYSVKENNTAQGVVDVEGAKRCKTAQSPVKQRTAVEYDALIRLVKSTKTERRSSPVTFATNNNLAAPLYFVRDPGKRLSLLPCAWETFMVHPSARLCNVCFGCVARIATISIQPSSTIPRSLFYVNWQAEQTVFACTGHAL